MLTSNVKTGYGCSASIEIYDTFVIGTTHLERMCDIPSKLASLLITHIMLKNDHDIDFVHYVNICDNQLTYKCLKLEVGSENLTWDEHRIHANKLEPILDIISELVVGEYRFLDTQSHNCGFYKDGYYCFDAFYELGMQDKYLRQLELVFDLETGILDKYNRLAIEARDS